MSQVPIAPAAAAPPAPVEPAPAIATPAPAPAPAPAAPLAAPAAAPAEQFVQVDRGRLDAWDGDYHRALQDANAYGSTMGKLVQTYGQEQADAMMAELLRTEPAPQGGYQPPAQPAVPAFNEEGARRMFGEMIRNELMPAMQQQFGSALGAHSEQQQQAWQHQQDMASAAQATNEFGRQTVEELGYKSVNDDGTPADSAWLANRVTSHFNDEVWRALAENEPADLDQAAKESYYGQPSPEVLQQAKEGVQRWKNMKWEVLAEAATEQTEIAATPGAGPAAGGAPKPVDEMSEEEQAEAASRHVPKESDTPGWGPPASPYGA